MQTFFGKDAHLSHHERAYCAPIMQSVTLFFLIPIIHLIHLIAVIASSPIFPTFPCLFIPKILFTRSRQSRRWPLFNSHLSGSYYRHPFLCLQAALRPACPAHWCGFCPPFRLRLAGDSLGPGRPVHEFGPNLLSPGRSDISHRILHPRSGRKAL